MRKWIAQPTAAPVPAQLLPVRIVPSLPASCEASVIEVQVHGARIQLQGHVDAKRLRAVLAALAGHA